MLLRNDDQRVDGQAHHDGGDTVKHVGGEAHGRCQAGAATVFGQKDAGGDADGNAQQTAQEKYYDRTDDGVGHAAAGLTNRRRNLDEEIEVDGAGARSLTVRNCEFQVFSAFTDASFLTIFCTD